MATIRLNFLTSKNIKGGVWFRKPFSNMLLVSLVGKPLVTVKSGYKKHLPPWRTHALHRPPIDFTQYHVMLHLLFGRNAGN